MPSFSNWRDDLREVVDSDTPEQNVKEIKDKKGIKNKVIINPTIPESLQEIGGELIDIREIDESASIALSPQELAIQKKKSQLDIRLAKKRQQSMNKIKKDAVDIEKQDELHQQQDKQMAALNKEEIQLAEVKVSRISPSDSKEDKKKKIQQMLDRQREWEKKQGKVPAGHATEEVVHEGKCDDCECPGCAPDGVGHQNPCIECGGHHKEEKIDEKVSPEVSRQLRSVGRKQTSRGEKGAGRVHTGGSKALDPQHTARSTRVVDTSRDAQTGVDSVTGEYKSAEQRKREHRANVARRRASGASMRGENFSNWRKELVESSECDCEGCGQDPCIKCGETHHVVNEVKVTKLQDKQSKAAREAMLQALEQQAVKKKKELSKEENDPAREHLIQRKQLMLDRQKLKLRMKAQAAARKNVLKDKEQKQDSSSLDAQANVIASESRDRALELVRQQIIKKHGKGAIYDAKRDAPTEAQKKAAVAQRKKMEADKAKAFAARAKKAGYKNPQDYANVVARYGSEDNMKKGRGLGT